MAVGKNDDAMHYTDSTSMQLRPTSSAQNGFVRTDCCWMYILSPVHPVSALRDVEATQGTSCGACLLSDFQFCILR